MYPSDSAQDYVPRKPSEEVRADTFNRHKDAVEFQKQLRDFLESRNDFFDKALISISGAGFGLTLLGVKIISDSDQVPLEGILPLTWIFWGLACFFLLLSYKRDALGLHRAIDSIDRHLAELHYVTYHPDHSDFDVSRFLDDHPLPDLKSRSRWMSWLGMFFCFAAFVVVCTFGIANVQWAHARHEAIFVNPPEKKSIQEAPEGARSNPRDLSKRKSGNTLKAPAASSLKEVDEQDCP